MKVMEKVVGKGHFQGAGEWQDQAWGSCSRRARRCRRISQHGTHCRLLPAPVDKSWEKALMDQYVLKGTCSFNEVVQCADGHTFLFTVHSWHGLVLWRNPGCGHQVTRGNAQGPGHQPLLLWDFWPGALHCTDSPVGLTETPSYRESIVYL